jgi:ATP/maltotriose-dependent transcriptional regulator MalT
LACVATVLICVPFGGLVHANDFPTVDRVLYVRDCLRANPGPQFEMINKCSCALDRLAEQVTYDEYVNLSTTANATTIGGERGAALRDNDGAQKDAKKFRDLQAKVKNSCFISAEPK